MSPADDLYLPKDRADRRLATLAVGGPFGAVKKQSSDLYAQTMAKRGFVTLAFDASFTSETGGEPRNVASPDLSRARTHASGSPSATLHISRNWPAAWKLTFYFAPKPGMLMPVDGCSSPKR